MSEAECLVDGMPMPDRDVTVATLADMKRRGEKIAVLTCYDASFARVLEAEGVEMLLVGDSLGMVVQGQESTLPVRVEHMVYHAANVARVRERSLLVVDMPFMSYASQAQAADTAARLMRDGGAQVVKLEGGAVRLDVVRHLCRHDIPVCAHLGLLPQSVHRLGGYRVQGRDEASAQAIRRDALALQDAGASMLVLECVPAALARAVTEALEIPVIGIGAGAGCDGQVLVVYDLLGISSGKAPRFVRNFMMGSESVEEAVSRFVAGVKDGSFPAESESFE